MASLCLQETKRTQEESLPNFGLRREGRALMKDEGGEKEVHHSLLLLLSPTRETNGEKVLVPPSQHLSGLQPNPSPPLQKAGRRADHKVLLRRWSRTQLPSSKAALSRMSSQLTFFIQTARGVPVSCGCSYFQLLFCDLSHQIVDCLFQGVGVYSSRFDLYFL